MAPIRTLVITKDSTQPIFVDMVGRWGVNWAAVHPYHVCVTGSGSVEIYKRDSKDIPKFPVKWEQGKGAISCEFRAALSSLLGGQWYIHPLDKMPSGMKPPMPKTLVHAKKEGNRPLQKTQDSSLKNRKATDRTPTGQVLVEKVNETANACTLYVVAFPYGAETIPVHNIIQAIHRSHRAQHPRDVLPEEETYIDLMMTVASELRGNDCEYAQTRHSLTPEIALKLLNRDMELLGRSMGYRITLGVVRDDGIKTVIGEVTNYVRVIWIWLRKPVYGDTNPMYSGCAALKALPPPEPSPAAPPEPVSLAMKIDSGTKTLDPAARYQLDFPHGAEAFESPHHVNEAIYQSHKAQHPNHDLKGQDKYNQLCFDKNNEFYKSMGLEPVLDHSSEHILSSFSYIVPRVGKQLGLRLALGIAYADGEKIFAGDVTRDTCIVWVLAERCSKCKSHPELCRGLEPLAALQGKLLTLVLFP
ncbi:hypothetical protein BX600DRAFT_36958 [Xylariales sp. PMI_506]|nr:hypothetical protein BX600DRAFT_36958 [Xylariales sp. PMI_506]